MSREIYKGSVRAVEAALFREPTKEFTVRELARYAGLSPTTVSSVVKGFKKKGFLNAEEFGRALKVSLNMENKDLLERKRVSNLESIKPLREELIKKFSRPKAIILYGSYSRGEDTEQSDIDLAVISVKRTKLELSRFEKSLNRKIDVIVFDDFSRIPEKLRSNIINGIKLYGVIDD